jgi:hypothetical protein
VTKRSALSKHGYRSWLGCSSSLSEATQNTHFLDPSQAASRTSNAGFFVLALAATITWTCSASAFSVTSTQRASRLAWWFAERRSFADLRRAALSCQSCSLSTRIKDSIASGFVPSQQDVGCELRPGDVWCPFWVFGLSLVRCRSGHRRSCNLAHTRRKVPHALVNVLACVGRAWPAPWAIRSERALTTLTRPIQNEKFHTDQFSSVQEMYSRVRIHFDSKHRLQEKLGIDMPLRL